MNEMHVSSDLSAYIDRELAPAEQARVSAHLEGCGRCSSQLAELRATATLMAALPDPRPTRSLVPSLTPKWNWLRPMRSFSAVTSGAFLMVFLIASVAQSGSDLGGGPLTPFSREPQPAAAPAAPQAEGPTTFGAAATSTAVADSRSAEAAQGAAGATDDEDAAEGRPEQTELRATFAEEQAPPTPLIWLGLSLVAAAVAFATHWRLRAA